MAPQRSQRGGAVGRSPIDELVAEVLENSLEHYGVKGMKWGVRRKNPSGEPASSDAERASQLTSRARTSGSKALSNAELRTAIERMNLEQQYERLRPRSTSEKVKGWIASTLLGIGKDQASQLARNYAADQVKEALKKR